MEKTTHPTSDAQATSVLTPPPPPEVPDGRRGAFQRFLDAVERLGNLLPHPVTLFALFAFGVVLASGVAGWLDLSVPDPRPEGARGRSATGTIDAVSLLNADGLRMIVENLVSNFVNFVPLGTVLVAMLGVGVAEASGLLSAAIRALVLKAPSRLLTLAVVFTGVLSNTASEAGYVILVPLAGVIFLAVGRHPLAGMAAAFAGVSGGYSANLLIGTVDPLLAGITQEAAQLIDPAYTVHPAVNWYFMVASTFMVTVAGTWVTTRIVEPKLGTYDPSHAEEGVADERSMEPLTPVERRGLWGAALGVLGVCLLVAVAVAIDEGLVTPVVRNADNKGLAQIAEETREKATLARERKLDLSEMEGSTFTTSNLGMYGIEEFTAIINPPNSAILAIGAIRDVPVVKDGEVVPGKRMKLTLSCDHRLVDGATGAEFLSMVQAYLEEPMTMLL